MTTITVSRPHKLQQQILNDKTRFRVLCIGRRWGKTETLIIALINRVLRGQRVWFCSPTNQNNNKVFPRVKKLLSIVPDVYINNTRLQIELPNGGLVEFVSLHEPDNLRGAGVDHIFIDEFAFVKQGVWDAVLRPMLATTQGGATIASTPNGTGTDFHALYLRGLDPEQPDWVTYHFSSGSSPMIPKHELDDIKRNTPERAFKQEFDALFLEDGGAVFRNLENCIKEPPANPSRVVFGVDWGKTNDYTVIIAIDVDSGYMLAMDRFNQISWTLQRQRLMTMYQKYKPFKIIAEKNSIGDPNIEELKKSGLPVQAFQTTAQSKAEVINSLALNLEQETIGLLNDPVLIHELKSYSIETLPSGNYRYTAPSGSHDDCVVALALANKARVLPSKVFI
jgi:hypothetical protein